jgi:hypothetical protein
MPKKIQKELTKLSTAVTELHKCMEPGIKKGKKRRRSGTVARNNSYSVTAPSAGSVVVNRQFSTPQIRTMGSSTYVRNTEPIQSITTAAAGAFLTLRATLIPSNIPWARGVASNFSRWRWNYLRFIYIPNCPTTTSGEIVMGLGYDFSDTAPTSVVDTQLCYNSVTSPYWAGYEGANLMNNFGAAKTMGCVTVDVDVRRLGANSGNQFYRYMGITTFNALANKNDQNIYSPGYLDISLLGGPAAATNVGTIFAEYVLELIEPVSGAMQPV